MKKLESCCDLSAFMKDLLQLFGSVVMEERLHVHSVEICGHIAGVQLCSTL